MGIGGGRFPFSRKRFEGVLHALDRPAQAVIGEDDELEAGVMKRVRRHLLELGGDDQHRRSRSPAPGELEDLVRRRLRRVDHDHVGAGVVIGHGPADRLVLSETGDQRLDAGDDDEIG